MKKLYSAILAIFITIVLTACEPPFIREGLDEYSSAICSVGLTQYLYPSEDFISKYAYHTGDFYYYDNPLFSAWGLEIAFSYLQYDSLAYDEAKKYCIDSFVLSESNTYMFGEYYFVENITFENFNNTYYADFPEWFNMFGYDDSTKTLFFLGYHNSDPHDDVPQLAATDFPLFLNHVYSQYYDFVNNEPVKHE